MPDEPRYLRLCVTSSGGSSATVEAQGLFEKRGLARVIAILLRQPTDEWRTIEQLGSGEA